MSINIDQPGFPDTKILEELANSLFKATTIAEQTDAAKSLLSYDSLAEQGSIIGAGNQPVKFTDNSPALPSVGGSGASPGSVLQLGSPVSGNQPQFTSAGPGNNNQFAYGLHGNSNQGSLPHAPGVSSAVPDQYNEVDLRDPQTSHHDPHFPQGTIPKSVAGSGRSPSVNQSSGKETLPFATDDHLFPDLKNVFSEFNTFETSGQLPVAPAAAGNYYFLDNNHPLQSSLNQEKPASAKQSNNSNARVKSDVHAHSPNNQIVKPPFDLNIVKSDFPILQEKVNGKPLIWLDNAATTQKPKQVIDRISYFYEHENSNIHRAAHELAARATDAYEGAREKVRRFLNARSTNEIIFVRGTTEAINLIANTFGDQFLSHGDEIIVSNLEHHANIVPWQLLAKRKGLKLRVIPVDDDGQILLDEYAKLLNSRTKLVSFTQVSNALGTVTPAKQIIDLAHANGSKVLLDGAQSVSHIRVDLQSLNPDFFVFSGHKIFGPTGIGVVYGKEDLLNSLKPWQGGGNMIKDVTFGHTQFHNAPSRFEAGTGNIADAVGLGAALDYVTKLGIDNIYHYEHNLLLYATKLMKEVPGLRLIGTAKEKTSVLSFTLEGYTNDEVGQALNKEGVAVRTGHHCAQPILRRFGVESTVRPSIAFYNTCSDIDTLVAVLHQLKK